MNEREWDKGEWNHSFNCIDEVKPNTVYNHGTQMAEDMGYPYGSLKEAYEAVQERGTENE